MPDNNPTSTNTSATSTSSSNDENQAIPEWLKQARALAEHEQKAVENKENKQEVALEQPQDGTIDVADTTAGLSEQSAHSADFTDGIAQELSNEPSVADQAAIEPPVIEPSKDLSLEPSNKLPTVEVAEPSTREVTEGQPSAEISEPSATGNTSNSVTDTPIAEVPATSMADAITAPAAEVAEPSATGMVAAPAAETPEPTATDITQAKEVVEPSTIDSETVPVADPSQISSVNNTATPTDNVPPWLKALHSAQDLLEKGRTAGVPQDIQQIESAGESSALPSTQLQSDSDLNKEISAEETTAKEIPSLSIPQTPTTAPTTIPAEMSAAPLTTSPTTTPTIAAVPTPTLTPTATPTAALTANPTPTTTPTSTALPTATPSAAPTTTPTTTPTPEKTSNKKNKAQLEQEERKKLMEAEQIYQQGMTTIRDLIAPSSMEIRYDMLRVEGMYAQSFYVYAYPRYLETNWLAPIINFDVTMDVSQFVYPIDSSTIMKVLKKKVAQMQASVRIAAEKGMVSDPALETALQDAEELRLQIQRGQEKFFQFALYFTIYSEDEKKIVKIAKQLESMLGGKLVLTRKTELQMEHGFTSCLPLCMDELEVTTNMNTSPLSTTFPFSSSDLTSNEGILYGLNRHNDSLIIFDRFSLENANAVVFAKSGAGKSYAIKLEILRSLMLDTDVIVIDPENEYEALAQTVGGTYLRVSLTSERRINPFDLPAPLDGEEVQPGDLLRGNIITLHGLLKIMLGGVTPEEEGILDKALIDVYALKGITMDLVNPAEFPPPTMEDLYDILSTMEGGQSLAQRLQKYTTGTYSGIFNKPTNVDLKSGLMVFCIRDLEDSLRPIAMYIILNYIWSRIRSELKRRILVIDEAWTMMQYEDSAKFLFGLVKRARKYYLGITTITQDVEDFIKSPYGKPVVTNSSMQLLLKQAPAAVDILGKVFNLTEGEKYMLLNSGVGQGLFFAGLKHVAIQIIASYTEDKIVTTNPEDLLRERERVE